MPEGDVIHSLATTFQRLFVGEKCEISSPQGRFSRGAELIDGWVLSRAYALGKHLFVEFTSPATHDASSVHTWWLHVHLGLYGSWRFAGDDVFTGISSIRGKGIPYNGGHESARGFSSYSGGASPHISSQAEKPEQELHKTARWGTFTPSSIDERGKWVPPEPRGQVRLRIRTAHGVADLSGPTKCELISTNERYIAESKLGPDPLSDGARSDVELMKRFTEAVRARKRAVGELVMDQSIIAGVGNIYRAEGLFLAGISPFRKGNRVSEQRLRNLWVLFCDLMNHGLIVARIETIQPGDELSVDLPDDPEAKRWYVYHRSGRPCLRCGTLVAEKLMVARRLFWCPNCQR